MKVISIDLEPVYDISMPTHHNFILENGVIAHNCSHSTSYAVLPYNQCWLKYNYPLQFWAGFMTVEADNKDKLREVLTECKNLILQPHATKSDGTKWVISDGKIIAPLVLFNGIGTATADELCTWFKNNLPTTIDEMCTMFREQKASALLKVSCADILILLYGGALDFMFDTINIEEIHSCANKIRKAFGSKAGNSETKKGVAVAAKNIKTIIELLTWRYEYNPVFTFNIGEYLNLNDFGLKSVNHIRTHTSQDFDVYQNDDFVFENESVLNYYTNHESAKTMALCGIVLSRTSSPTKTGKASYIIELFTGNSIVKLRLWSEYKTNEVCERKYGNLKPGNYVFVPVVPKIYNNYRTLSIRDVYICKVSV